ncbi:hypothetical protein BD779DRAFT_1603023 [Infundibulicybe gibba]|nr:hypothetical protein BD779DRAFT_1603023 [Infundibulicybe gibba]
MRTVLALMVICLRKPVQSFKELSNSSHSRFDRLTWSRPVIERAGGMQWRRVRILSPGISANASSNISSDVKSVSIALSLIQAPSTSRVVRFTKIPEFHGM